MREHQSKASFRKGCLQRLRKRAQQNSYRIDKQIEASLRALIKRHNAKRVMLYIPLKMEVDVMPLIGWLRRQKREVLVPFMEGESFRLVKYRYPLQTKQFGIKEPKYSRQYRNKEIDIAIVPIVGVDSTYRRIGFGKGMYDRFFEKEMKNIRCVVFVARALCYTKAVITDHYDVKADLIVVP